jgi:hypothetical protein
MANFLIIVDPDKDRRSRFVKDIKPFIPPVEGLIPSTYATNDFCTMWAAHERAPVNYVVQEILFTQVYG